MAIRFLLFALNCFSGEQNISDHLRLKNLIFWGRHGHFPFERESGNRFEVDLDLQVDLSPAIASDNLADTADLARAYEIAQRLVEGEPCELIETLAGRIAAELLTLPRVQSATVRLRKMSPPLPGAVQGIMEAEVTRVP